MRRHLKTDARRSGLVAVAAAGVIAVTGVFLAGCTTASRQPAELTQHKGAVARANSPYDRSDPLNNPLVPDAVKAQIRDAR